jgi:hypothetical protein
MGIKGQLLMRAKKQMGCKTSNYHMGMASRSDSSMPSQDQPGFLGKVRANFVGTEFILFDNGISSAKLQAALANNTKHGRAAR